MHKLTLDQPIPYQIKVPGYLDKRASDWIGKVTILTESGEANFPVTILAGNFDQSALLGLLRRLLIH